MSPWVDLGKGRVQIDVLLPIPRDLVAKWVHFTLFGIQITSIELKVYTFLGAYELSS